MDEMFQLAPTVNNLPFLEPLLQWGLAFIRIIQSGANPPLTVFMKLFTHLGSASVYLLLLPLIYWCIDEKKGLRLTAALLISAWVNISLKYLLDQPRPFFSAYDPSVGMIPERLAGMPSGHAQNSLVLWMIIASWTKKKTLYAAAAVLCLLTGFSRIYLGVHFPTDILGGWILGGIILGVYFFVTNRFDRYMDGEGSRLENFFQKGENRAGLFCAAAAAFIMILYRPSEEVLAPAAMLLGMAYGYTLNRRHICFRSSAASTAGTARWIIFCARFVLGLAGMALVFFVFESFSHRAPFAAYYPPLYFLRFFCTALWVYAGAPRLFGFLRLAECKPVK